MTAPGWPEPMGVLLDVRGLRTRFTTRGGVVRAVDDVSWDVSEGETVALVGESGCGKSCQRSRSCASSPRPPAGSSAGRSSSRAATSWGCPRRRCAASAAARSRMIFQEPMTSLNPVLSIGRQLTEGLEIHLGMAAGRPARARRRAARHGRHPRPGAAPSPVPAPVQRRHAPAHDDRDGARLRPVADPRRRAHDGARRDDPGADPRADARTSRGASASPCSSSPTTSAWSRATPTA